ncbi:ER-golgi trafficking TRAPP I complex 85 kDa subunit-domain-containing protein [Limtongia smithiae]|uniref:ER-golgi trafficking TRAPP I complex 85 kDa subunit-domain-containing protein n=1 Tax=Limtongia smithiae TaxID=1125753 RepID=UPI0034CE0787
MAALPSTPSPASSNPSSPSTSRARTAAAGTSAGSTSSGSSTPAHASPAPSLALSFTSFLHGGASSASSSAVLLSAGGPLSPTSGVSPSHLSAVAALIAQSFAPRVAVFASDDANEFARDMGCASVLELLRPLGDTVQGPVAVHDSQGITVPLDDFGVRFVSSSMTPTSSPVTPSRSNSVAQGADAGVSATRSRSNSKATYSAPPCFEIRELDALLDLYLAQSPRFFTISDTSDGNITSPLSPATSSSASPSNIHDVLYYKFLQRLLATPPVSPHESFSHPVAAVIVISSRNPQPIETLAALYRAGIEAPVPQYMSKDYLRYYVLLHDEDNSEFDKSLVLFDRMKRHFGLHCHMIRLHSRTATPETAAAIGETLVRRVPSRWISAGEEVAYLRDPHRQEKFHFQTDTQNLRAFVREMVAQSVIPFMERCITTWNEQIASSRRGLTGRFFSASRRLLGNTTRGTNATTATGNYDASAGCYGYMSSEALMRKLADYAFMLRDWRFAQSTYDILRKDFLNDKAWKYHAGAQEMAAASLILSGTPLSSKARAEMLEPLLDSATYSYISRASQPTYALRTILISSELLRSRGGGAADDAAKWLTKAITDRLMGNLAHALVIERISACFAIRRGVGSQGWGNRNRKAAFWQVVAAKEWVALDKKWHARMCLDEADERVYDRLEWMEKKGTLVYELRQATQGLEVYDKD